MAELRQIVRLCDTDLNGKLKVERSIRKIKGMGHALSKAVRIRAGLDENQLLGELTDVQLKKVEGVIKNPQNHDIPFFMFNRRKDYDSGVNKHLTGAELDLENRSDVARMKSIKSYKGIRHAAGKKVRGQRTKSTGRHGVAIGVAKKKMVPGASKEGEQ